MHCPFCSTDETKVIDSRLVAEGAQVRRRRECLSCTERFTTYEAAELVLPRIIKQDGSREPFDEEKLRSGLLRALEKRPVSVENCGMGDPLYHDAERLKVLVERHLLHTGSAKAKALLDDWTSELGNFRKVMPRDYQRALKALEDEREQAAMEAAE